MKNIKDITEKGSIVVKVCIYNRTGTEDYDEASECVLCFSDGTGITYEC